MMDSQQEAFEAQTGQPIVAGVSRDGPPPIRGGYRGRRPFGFRGRGYGQRGGRNYVTRVVTGVDHNVMDWNIHTHYITVRCDQFARAVPVRYSNGQTAANIARALKVVLAYMISAKYYKSRTQGVESFTALDLAFKEFYATNYADIDSLRRLIPKPFVNMVNTMGFARLEDKPYVCAFELNNVLQKQWTFMNLLPRDQLPEAVIPVLGEDGDEFQEMPFNVATTVLTLLKAGLSGRGIECYDTEWYPDNTQGHHGMLTKFDRNEKRLYMPRQLGELDFLSALAFDFAHEYPDSPYITNFYNKCFKSATDSHAEQFIVACISINN